MASSLTAGDEAQPPFMKELCLHWNGFLHLVISAQHVMLNFIKICFASTFKHRGSEQAVLLYLFLKGLILKNSSLPISVQHGPDKGSGEETIICYFSMYCSLCCFHLLVHSLLISVIHFSSDALYFSKWFKYWGFLSLSIFFPSLLSKSCWTSKEKTKFGIKQVPTVLYILSSTSKLVTLCSHMLEAIHKAWCSWSWAEQCWGLRSSQLCWHDGMIHRLWPVRAQRVKTTTEEKKK